MTILRNSGHGGCKLNKSNKQVKLKRRPKHAIRCQSKGSYAIMPYFMVAAPSVTSQKEVVSQINCIILYYSKPAFRELGVTTVVSSNHRSQDTLYISWNHENTLR